MFSLRFFDIQKCLNHLWVLIVKMREHLLRVFCFFYCVFFIQKNVLIFKNFSWNDPWDLTDLTFTPLNLLQYLNVIIIILNFLHYVISYIIMLLDFPAPFPHITFMLVKGEHSTAYHVIHESLLKKRSYRWSICIW